MTVSKESPFYASILERTLLSGEDPDKQTMHLVLDIEGSGICYSVGDSLAILPQNSEEDVTAILSLLNATGEEEIIEKRSQKTLSFEFYLTSYLSMSKLSGRLISHVLDKETSIDTVKETNALYTLPEFLKNHQTNSLTPQALADLSMPLTPRFYSIASSQKSVGNQIHLTVALLKYITGNVERLGVCTDFLCQRAPLNSPVVPVYLHPSNSFNLPPSPDAPMIMVGPGTGVAPFRAFLQERKAAGAKGAHWLFFGERTRKNHYYYEPEWESLAELGALRLDLAFSRDQAEKIYVQHLLQEKGQEIFHWINKGAYFYVCGDAKNMAKDVEQALLSIFQEHGSYSEDEAKAALKSLRKEGRYLRDVY